MPAIGVLVLTAVACSRPAPLAAPLHASLGGEIVARVGDVALPAAMVARVAEVQRTTPARALDHLLEDALAAEGARALGLDREPSVRWQRTTILAREITDAVSRDARAAGPPSDEELAQVTRLHWLEVDLPEQVRVVHAVVLAPKDPAQNDAARALAGRIAAAVAGATDADDFKVRAEAVPTGGLSVVAQSLPAFVADGRFAEEAPSFIDPGFAAAAFGLRSPGDTTPVVHTTFGWHVIRLVERLPAKILPAETRRARFADEVVTHRARVALAALFKTARGTTRVRILPDAEARMAAFTPRESP